MAVLDAEIQGKIDELRGLGFREKDTIKKFKIMEKSWELYPEPKTNWNEAYNTARYAFNMAIAAKDQKEARKWLDRMINNNNTLHNNDIQIQHETGKYLYETGDFEGAYDSWDKIVRIKMVSYRNFEDEDPKYKKFYKEQRALKDLNT